MADDIVAKARKLDDDIGCCCTDDPFHECSICIANDAADEIERLRQQLHETEKRLEELNWRINLGYEESQG